MAQVPLLKYSPTEGGAEAVDSAADDITVASATADSLVADDGGTGAFIDLLPGQGAAVGATGRARLRFNDTTDTLQVSENGGAYVDVNTGAGGTTLDSYRWVVNGKPAVSNGIDNAWIAPRAGTITRVTLFRRTAGSSGSTIVDVDLNGTTIYTTQGNRPTVTQAAGNNAIDATTDMDVTAVAQNDRLEVNVDQVEAGNPQDIAVILEIEYT